ncbi:MAG TPA: D-alanyl-D-alanine carboxypeptidase family protein [Gammaproteobacteria bacterium]|nr:D-alanyl-D-alanine carboxypeptidase family protein [Gammaproteobacteria bacterium]
MRKCLIAFGLSFSGICSGQGIPIPAPPQIAASSYMLMDFNTGEIIAESNADAVVEPASITKLMTSYVAFRALEEGLIAQTDQVRVSEKAWRTGGSRMYIEVDTEVSVEDLLRGMIVQSGNDASIALAEHVAGSEDAFVSLMNQYADTLGMQNTHFENTTGLPAGGHLTTARDSAIIARAIIEEFPDLYRLYAEREFTYGEIRQPNRNGLLWRDDSVDGLKTGHTDAAGYCLVSSAQRGPMRLIAVVMGAPSAQSRLDSSQALLNYGFRFYETKRLYSGGDEVSQSRVWKGAAEVVSIGVVDDIWITAPRGRDEALSASAQVDTLLVAPIAPGHVVGTLEILYEGELRREVPLVALGEVAQGSLWKRMVDEVELWFQ